MRASRLEAAASTSSPTRNRLGRGARKHTTPSPTFRDRQLMLLRFRCPAVAARSPCAATRTCISTSRWLWNAPRKASSRSRARVPFRAAPRHGLDTVETSQRSGGPRQSLLRLGQLLRQPDTAYTPPPSHAAPHRHVSTTTARTSSASRLHPPARPYGATSEGVAAVRQSENSIAFVRSPRGTLAPASPHLLIEPAIVSARRALPRAGHRSIGMARRGLRPRRVLIARPSPASTTTTARASTGRLHLPTPRAGSFLGGEEATSSTSFRATTSRWASPDDDDAQPHHFTLPSTLDDATRVRGERRFFFITRRHALGRPCRSCRRSRPGHATSTARRRARRSCHPLQIPRSCAATYFPNQLLCRPSVATKQHSPLEVLPHHTARQTLRSVRLRQPLMPHRSSVLDSINTRPRT